MRVVIPGDRRETRKALLEYSLCPPALALLDRSDENGLQQTRAHQGVDAEIKPDPMRLFAALPVPDDVTAALKPLQKNLSGAAWRPAENFHITLAFFGDVPRDIAYELDEELASFPTRQIEVEISGLGWFGRREPRSVWARVRPSEELDTLAGLCRRAGKRVGLRMEKQAYAPHITLAYCHGTLLQDAEAFVSRHAGVEAGPFWADRFHLFSSHFGKGASRYVPEADYPLG